MPSLAVVDRAALAQVFKDPRTLRAFEALLQNAASPGALTSTGEIKPFAGGTPPDGWLECDGSVVSRNVYADLFNVAGVTWGAGDGVSTFNLPDLRGRSLIGRDGTHALGATGGAAAVNLSVGQLPSHSHAVTDPAHTHVFTGVAHTHVVSDPGHAHSESVATAASTAGAAAGGATPGSGTTGSNTTGITNQATVATGTNAATATGITIQNTGAGDPVPTQSPFAAVVYMVKT